MLVHLNLHPTNSDHFSAPYRAGGTSPAPGKPLRPPEFGVKWSHCPWNMLERGAARFSRGYPGGRGARDPRVSLDPLPSTFYCIFRPVFFSATCILPTYFSWKFFQKTLSVGMIDQTWRKISNVFECWPQKPIFWAIQEAYFLTLLRKKVRKFSKKIRRDPKIRFLLHFGPLF